jgi:Putative peptidoglycan binding domain
MNWGSAFVGRITRKERDYFVRTKYLWLASSLAATILITSSALAAPHKKAVTNSQSRPQRVASQTTQVAPAYRHGTTSSYMGTRRYAGTQRYAGTRQYSGSRYYYAPNRYAGNGYYGGTRYYYGGPTSYYGGSGYPYYSYYSSWPSASYGYYPYSYYGGYPYSYYSGHPYTYSYYQGGYGYDTSTVAAVQRRLGELGYYHGVVDGVIGPQTRGAIAAFENNHGMIVDGAITTRLLDRIGLS